jgi:hypothetical protein
MTLPSLSKPKNGFKGLTLLQPWGSFLFPPVTWADQDPPKLHETRSWTTKYRGPIVITTSASMDHQLAWRAPYLGYYVRWLSKFINITSGRQMTCEQAYRLEIKKHQEALMDGGLEGKKLLYAWNEYQAKDAYMLEAGATGGFQDNHALYRSLPLGRAIGLVTLVDVQRTEDVVQTISKADEDLGDYSKGRFAWKFTSPVLFPVPIPCRGSLRLWDVTDELATKVLKQIQLLSKIAKLEKARRS